MNPDECLGAAPSLKHDDAQAGDQVDGPAHYGGKDNPYEVIKVMIAHHGTGTTAAFCHLNAVKYLARAGKKGDMVTKTPEDLRKAAWYATAAADLLEHGELRHEH